MYCLPPAREDWICTPAIADKREELAELCRQYDVARLEVFGSAARGTDFDPGKSDADFLVEFDPDSNLPPFEQFFGLVDAFAGKHWGVRLTCSRITSFATRICVPPSTNRAKLFMRRDARVLLTDIEQAGADIEIFTAGMDSDAFAADVRTRAAVERKFEIIGEAVNRLHKDHPELAMRNSRKCAGSWTSGTFWPMAMMM